MSEPSSSESQKREAPDPVDFLGAASTYDIVFRVEEKTFFARKSHLHAHTDFFRAKRFAENKRHIVEVEGISPKLFDLFLGLIDGSNQLNDDNIESILRIAKEWNAIIPLQACAEFVLRKSGMKLSDKLMLADKYKMTLLVKQLLDRTRTKSDLEELLPHDLNLFGPNTLVQIFEKARETLRKIPPPASICEKVEYILLRVGRECGCQKILDDVKGYREKLDFTKDQQTRLLAQAQLLLQVSVFASTFPPNQENRLAVTRYLSLFAREERLLRMMGGTLEELEEHQAYVELQQPRHEWDPRQRAMLRGVPLRTPVAVRTENARVAILAMGLNEVQLEGMLWLVARQNKEFLAEMNQTELPGDSEPDLEQIATKLANRGNPVVGAPLQPYPPFHLPLQQPAERLREQIAAHIFALENQYQGQFPWQRGVEARMMDRGVRAHDLEFPVMGAPLDPFPPFHLPLQHAERPVPQLAPNLAMHNHYQGRVPGEVPIMGRGVHPIGQIGAAYPMMPQIALPGQAVPVEQGRPFGQFPMRIGHAFDNNAPAQQRGAE